LRGIEKEYQNADESRADGPVGERIDDHTQVEKEVAQIGEGIY